MRLEFGDPGVDQLQHAYRERQVFLVLGAGVSVGSGLPLWSELLRRIFTSCYAEAGPRLFDTLTHEGMAFPVMTSLLEETARDREDGYRPREAFTDLVRAALYRDFPWFPAGVPPHRARNFVDAMDNQNSTLRAVSAFCTSRSPDTGRFLPNPRVRAVITFNLDALLQAHSRAKYCLDPRQRPILRTIERPSAGSQPDKLSVYHVHGHMRFDRKLGNRKKEAPDQMVLTEQDYFDAFNDPMRLFNYTFLHLLREYTAVFVGLSMQDENLRRLLHHSKHERVRALRAEGRPDDQIRDRVLRHVAFLPASSDQEVRRAQLSTLEPLGVRVVWLPSFGELPAHLQRVYETDGAAWSDVDGG
ncbi:SIR2 family protein [Geodermatophilus sp. SYSU D00766]